MSKELVISANRHETRVAILEDDQVVEVYHQRENEYSLAGSIHKGRVTRVLPGMQSAFVDIGLDRDAFLYVSDFFEDNEEYDKIVTSVEEKVLKLDRVPQQAPPPGVTAPASAPVAEAAAPAAVEELATPVVAAAEGPAAGAPPPDHRRDDRDRRGRRGRRRRGQKNDRRGLPDSKFYSPGQQPEERPVVEEEAAAPEPQAPEADDFFVLPGESLAKYTGGNISDEIEEAPEGGGAFEETTVSGIAAEPAPEPQPELAAAAVEVAEAEAEEAEAEAEASEVEAVEAEPVEDAETTETAEMGEEMDPLPLDAAEPVEAAGDDPVPAESGDEGGEVVAEEEGPEPARIPTSLTATLREQGPRYLHRVSRRMRRRGREGREGGREGRPPAEGHRGPQQGPAPEARPAEPGPRPVEQRTVQAPRNEPRPEKSGAPSISDLLKEGQEIIVQIAKEPLGQKGARITSHIALPGRFLVYMPTVDHIGVSRKIPSDDERLRLKRILQGNRTGIPGGYIVRTAGEGRSEEELRADMMFLYNLWLDMRQKAERKPAPHAHPPRPECRGTCVARPAHLGVQEHLGG